MDSNSSAQAVTGALASVIRDNLDANDAGRRLAQPVVDAIRAAGVARLMLSTENGGSETPLATALFIYEQLAGMDPSVGWVVWNQGLPCLFSRSLSTNARSQIFGRPDWLYASSTRPSGTAVRTGDSYRLTGRWALVSGCELAEWVILTALVASESEEPYLRFFFVHQSELEIIDTWHVGGLKGTGSHDVAVNDLSVPLERCLIPDDPSTIPGPYGQLPIIATLNLGMAAQFLGIAQAAVDITAHLARTRVSPSPEPDLRDRPEVQLAVAGYTAAIEAARSHLHARAADLWRQASANTPAGADDLASVYAAGWHAIRTAVLAVDELYSQCGTSAIYRDCPLERFSRDLRVMRQHVLTQTLWPMQAGRVALGLLPDNPLYAV